jgi:glyoxylase-like metal-dependent hydrolase (beta-lactamase superfamily II)
MSQTDPTLIRPLNAAGDDDGGETFTVTLLDVGSKEYGDCILCQAGEDAILIDGSHPGDEQGSFSIPRQLRYLLRQPSGPVRVSLLVVTHVHSDHYGCLPAMVLDGTLTADFALVADPRLGWGEVEGADEEGGFAAFAAAHPLAPPGSGTRPC